MKIGSQVLGTYRSCYNGSSKMADVRAYGVVDSKRLPLGFYWLVFSEPNGTVRQMNHESEIGGDQNRVTAPSQVYSAVFNAAATHFRNGGRVTLCNGLKPRAYTYVADAVKALNVEQPITPNEALDELARIEQTEVIL